MKNNFGASLYYASDKNIFDALCRSKVNSETIQQMFLARNIIVSKKTDREDLASYFSRLPHDLADHQSIAARLGVITRRERSTSVEMILPIKDEELANAIKVLKAELEKSGDVVHKGQDMLGRTTLTVKYSSLDYRKAEFSQHQIRDGELLLIPSTNGYKIRSTCNDYIDSIRDSFILELERQTKSTAKRDEISLFAISDVTKRSEFFHSLMFKMPGYDVKDVHEVYVYKKRPDIDNEDEEEKEKDKAEDVHVERVLLRGNGVSRSKQLQNLIERDDSSEEDPYYIVRIAWVVAEKKGIGQRYEIECRFEDPANCTGFSFMLRGVYGVDILTGNLNKTKRPPNPGEVETISLAIEEHSKKLRDELII